MHHPLDRSAEPQPTFSELGILLKNPNLFIFLTILDKNFLFTFQTFFFHKFGKSESFGQKLSTDDFKQIEIFQLQQLQKRQINQISENQKSRALPFLIHVDK